LTFDLFLQYHNFYFVNVYDVGSLNYRSTKLLPCFALPTDRRKEEEAYK